MFYGCSSNIKWILLTSKSIWSFDERSIAHLTFSKASRATPFSSFKFKISMNNLLYWFDIQLLYTLKLSKNILLLNIKSKIYFPHKKWTKYKYYKEKKNIILFFTKTLCSAAYCFAKIYIYIYFSSTITIDCGIKNEL